MNLASTHQVLTALSILTLLGLGWLTPPDAHAQLSLTPAPIMDLQGGLDPQMLPVEPGSGYQCWSPGGPCGGWTPAIRGRDAGANCWETNVNGRRQGNCVQGGQQCTLAETDSRTLVRNCCDPADTINGICWRSVDPDGCSDVHDWWGLLIGQNCSP